MVISTKQQMKTIELYQQRWQTVLQFLEYLYVLKISVAHFNCMRNYELRMSKRSEKGAGLEVEKHRNRQITVHSCDKGLCVRFMLFIELL